MVCSYSSGPFATTLYSLLPSSWDVNVRQKHDEEEDWHDLWVMYLSFNLQEWLPMATFSSSKLSV